MDKFEEFNRLEKKVDLERFSFDHPGEFELRLQKRILFGRLFEQLALKHKAGALRRRPRRTVGMRVRNSDAGSSVRETV